MHENEATPYEAENEVDAIKFGPASRINIRALQTQR